MNSVIEKGVKCQVSRVPWLSFFLTLPPPVLTKKVKKICSNDCSDVSNHCSFAQKVEYLFLHRSYPRLPPGATSNVGLMAAKAEEYGSHDKTFVIPEA